MKCMNCGTEFEAKRSTAKYCSDKCRKLAFHEVSVPEVSVPEVEQNAKDRTLSHPESVTKKDVTVQPDNMTMTPEGLKENVPDNYGQPGCKCRHCANAAKSKSGNILNHGAYKPAGQLGYKEINRVSLPGDADYDGVCLRPEYDSRRINTA